MSSRDDAARVTLAVGAAGRPHFLGTSAPALSWQVAADGEGWRQAAAELELDHDGHGERARVDGSTAVNVAWPFAPLPAFARARVRVRVQSSEGVWTPWSEWESADVASLAPAELEADFVTVPSGPEPAEDLHAPRPTFRVARAITVGPDLRRAVLSATSHGVYEAVVNGNLTSDEVLAPGWTAYQSRLLVQTHDVTDLLTVGENVLGAEVAEGWFGERYGFDGVFARGYEGPLDLWMHLRLEYADGRVETMATDASWVGTWQGPTVSASIYQGESRDDRLSDSGLATTVDGEIALPSATPVEVVSRDRAVLRPATLPPVRRTATVDAVDSTWEDDALVLDFGQNLVGWLRFEVHAPAGTTITVRHAEVLEDGALATRPLRHAAATDSIVVGDSGIAHFEPRFTFHGFRYAEISGLPDAHAVASVEAVVVHTDMVRTGEWSSSHPLLNQLHSNVVWGMRSNFLSIPTDCPQRDERLGWTGDIQVFAPTAAYLFDSTSMLRSWLEDLAIEQQRFDGVVPSVVPTSLDAGPVLPAAAWGDAATLVPDALFAATGDLELVRDAYPSMKAWVDVVLGCVDDNGLWEAGFQFGDWLDPSAPPHNPADAKTRPEIVATAYLYRSLVAVTRAARALGLDSDADAYERMADRTRAAFLETYVTGAGRMVSDAHTAYSVAIGYGLLDGDSRRQAAGDRLAELVVSHAYRIRTGFVGTPVICDALAATGHRDVAYRMLLETECPSWLYPVTQGATTVWERWDSMLPDGSVNPGEMTSFNHYALGAVADWMHRDIAGLDAARAWEGTSPAGYPVVRFAPRPGGGVTSAQASLETPLGTFSIAWECVDGVLHVTADVPPNGDAILDLPGVEREDLGHGRTVREVPSAVPDMPRARITLDTPLAELVNDGEAVGAMMGVFGATGYFIAFGWNDGKWRPDFTLRNGLPMIKAHQFAALTQALTGLNDARGFAPVPGEWELAARSRTS